MVKLTGYLLAAAGIALLYHNSLYVGIVTFVFGGFFAKGLFFTIKSCAIIVGAFMMAYGYHNEVTPVIVVTLAVCFLIVFFSRRRADSSGAFEWGCEWDITDFFSSDGSSCDDGGCGGD